MFISFKYKEYLGKDGKHAWRYELTDSEFGTVSVVSELGIWGIVIQEYGKRKLNVAANLMRAFIWEHKQYPDWPIQEIIDDGKKNNPLFPPYEKDLQKYLVLL
jgi:hypothetical protein